MCKVIDFFFFGENEEGQGLQCKNTIVFLQFSPQRMLKDYNGIKKKPTRFKIQKKEKIFKIRKWRETLTSASLGGILPEALKKFKKKVAGFPYMDNSCCIVKQKHKSEILWNEPRQTFWHE